MDRLVIQGGTPLHGRVAISGAKNAALPCLAATLLTIEPVILNNLPAVSDINTMIRVLQSLGCKTERDQNNLSNDFSITIKTDIPADSKLQAPYELVKTMRASILILGPLLARFGRASASLPGGCAIGARPVNLHLEALERMGATLKINKGYIEASVPNGRLKAIDHTFEKISVGASENILMAATLAEGTTILRNAAMEPEVCDLAKMLVNMGAKIEGINTPTLIIHGVERLIGCSHTIIPDRIEAGTFLCAVAATCGDVVLENINLEQINTIIDLLEKCGCSLTKIKENNKEEIRIKREYGQRLNSKDITTAPYPGFPTDLQAQVMAVMTQASGISIIHETIFENRFQHAIELERLGATLRINDNTAIVAGPSHLTGCTVMATDLRASATLAIAGLVAQGETIIDRIYHLDRGYAHIEQKLNKIGARITRISSDRISSFE